MLILAGAWYTMSRPSHDMPRAQLGSSSPISEINLLVRQISRLMLLPEGETPVVGTITNASALSKTQPFFKDASDGDKVLVYSQAQKAILYSPSRGILINVGPIFSDTTFLNSSTQQQTPSISQPAVTKESPLPSTATAPLTLVVRNGSKTPGLAIKVADSLAQEDKLYKVVATEAAARKDYVGNTIILLDSAFRTTAEALAYKLSARITTNLPAGEKLNNASALVILGN